MKRILITGANGRIGRLLQKALSPDYNLRLTDLSPCDTTYSKDIHIIDILHSETLRDAMKDVDYVIHLAAIADEISDAERILQTNVVGTLNVLDAASNAGVSRFIFASSIHAVGFYPRDMVLTRDVMPRPSGIYGASKVACETLVRLYADKFGLSGICLRISTLEHEPHDTRELVTWLSEPDAIKLFKSALQAEGIHFDIVYGVSNNTQKKLSNAGSQVFFHPKDDAENYRTQIEHESKPEGTIARHFHGGPFAERFFRGNLERTLKDEFSDSFKIRSKL